MTRPIEVPLKPTLALMVVSLWGGHALGQITDPAQRKDWYYLQTLSKQLEEYRQCSPAPDKKDDWDKYWRTYNSKATELVVEIESYAKTYAERRSKYESPETFAYRVWDTTLSVGKREARKLSSDQCLVVRAVP